MKTIEIIRDGKILRIFLNRPDLHNAFNDVMIGELKSAYDDAAKDDALRIVILSGRGKSFCAGADLNWMRNQINFIFDENLNDALKLADLMYTIYHFPKPTIGRINGTTIGGGTGLAAVNDIVIASKDAKFSLSEVKIGLVPACISPYVLKRMGEKNCREYFITGERLAAEKAKVTGLVNEVVEPENLDDMVDSYVKRILSSGPNAISVCKELVENVPAMSIENAKAYTAEVIAKLRVSDEGQEGMAAFFEKRKPLWAE
ncbi:enoyl-CoA hydratase/isomerase family protein [bacterium]|nr:enoyl-CoA hydratase/isomerase family protein [bacterium]